MSTNLLNKALAFFLVAGLVPALGLAQTWPMKPLRMIVPFPPGGSVDAVARLIAPRMSQSLGQAVVIDNRPGASSNIGMELAARAAGDGYTLLANTTPIVANSSLYPKLAFHPDKDFAPISLVVSGPSILVVTPSLAVRNIQDLIAAAKAKPGNLKYTSSGPGTLTHLAAELFKYLTLTNILNVTYRGGGPAITAVVSGEGDISFQTPIAVSGLITSGRLRAIAVTSKERLSTLPSVPTIAESGVPRYEFNSWVGVLAPVSTPKPIIELLHAHIVKAARAPEVTSRVAREDAEVIASTPAKFRETIAAETALWSKVIREMKMRND